MTVNDFKRIYLHLYGLVIFILLRVEKMLPYWADFHAKKRRLEAEGDMARGDHDDHMDVQISEPIELNEDLEMDAVEDCSLRPG